MKLRQENHHELQPWLHSEFTGSLLYILRPCLEKKFNGGGRGRAGRGGAESKLPAQPRTQKLSLVEKEKGKATHSSPRLCLERITKAKKKIQVFAPTYTEFKTTLLLGVPETHLKMGPKLFISSEPKESYERQMQNYSYPVINHQFPSCQILQTTRRNTQKSWRKRVKVNYRFYSSRTTP